MATAVLAAEEGHGAQPDLTMSKWVHFGLLAIGIAVLWAKVASPAIKARGEQIRKDLDDARKLKAESDARVADIEKRLGNLSGEIETFRVESRKLLAIEAEKIRIETANLLSRVQAQSEHEITSLTKAALYEVKAEAARLAVELAEKRIASGISPEVHAGLVSGFVSDLKEVRA